MELCLVYNTYSDGLGGDDRMKTDAQKRASAKYYSNNKEKYLSYRETNREKIKKYNDQWKMENWEKYNNCKNECIWKRHGIHGLPPDIHARRNGTCDVCGASRGKRALCVDHDHATGLFRGVLCYECNSMMGKSDEMVPIFEAAIRYLNGCGG
jgi:hypothetical protein